MARDEDDATKVAKAHSVFVRLALPPYTIHFKSPTYLQPATLDLLDKKVCKETLKSTAQNESVRQAIGCDVKFWSELVNLLKAAIPSLERRSFKTWDPSSVDYESTSGAHIADHCPALWRDLERLNDLVSITRNVLTVGQKAQDLAAEHGLDSEIFRLVNCCVRVTARGYDGDAETGDEEKWQWVVNAYKKLLITSLQFLNNLVAQNERRKLTLWVSLFDNANDSVIETGLTQEKPQPQHTNGIVEALPVPLTKPLPPITPQDILLAYGTNGPQRISPLEMEGAVPMYDEEGFKQMPYQLLSAKPSLKPNAYVFFGRHVKDRVVDDFQTLHNRGPTIAEIHLSIPRYWHEAEETTPDLWGIWSKKLRLAFSTYENDRAAYERRPALSQILNEKPTTTEIPPTRKRDDTKQIEQKIKALEEQFAGRYSTDKDGTANVGDAKIFTNPLDPLLNAAEKNDMRMLFTAEAGAKILESGKAELMKRLEGYGSGNNNNNGDGQPHLVGRPRSLSKSPPPRLAMHPGEVARRHMSDSAAVRGRSAVAVSVSATQELAVEEAFAEDSADEDEEDEDEEESDEEEEEEGEDEDEEEEDYPGSTEDGRGLLTDVPLILGPSEIEVLPMLIMSGIVPPPSPTPTQNLHNTHTLRTHLLLSQPPGRNLLRELLIFVAAWDLREEELYFKFMLKIMEAILRNGLMPYAYHAFRDRSRSKDIISPAQAVIMKLLTCIFRGRGEVGKTSSEKEVVSHAKQASTTSPQVDLHILNFIFTEFRQHIIPQTCALIFLQGQIHKGRASPEDFPLNLWDMERMYEGVYQYLEFFAVLTEEQASGGRGEGVDGVGGGGVLSWKKILAEWEMASELVTLLRELEGGIPKMGAPPAVQQVHRRGISSQAALPATQHRPLSADAALESIAPVAQVERPFDLNADPTLPPLPIQPPTTQQQIFEPETPLAYPEDQQGVLAQHDQDEPSDFEWRNLKKLTVLVLSSLIWKNKLVQDQVRVCGGLEALVGCCRQDEHNPYIREHAIMCLRFAVEGNEVNADVIKGMAAEQGSRGMGMLEGGSVTLTAGTGALVEDDVPREVLDTNGYETFMDQKGQVGLRRKNDSSLPLPSASNTTTTQTAVNTAGVSKPRLSGTKMTAEKAAELMQNALRDLPLGDKLVTDKQKAEALARLDRAFESTEKALGGKKR